MQHLHIRRSHERGYANHRWLQSYHSFSFAHYYDPQHTQFSVLRVMNDDVIAPNKGFGMHPHHDMEIITYMLEGELQHQDDMGNTSVIKAGDVQRMTAGSGVVHSEVNASSTKPAHLLQIWILPAALGLTPSYEEKHFSSAQKLNQWCLIAAPDHTGMAIKIHQDVSVYATLLDANQALNYSLRSERSAYIQVANGNIVVNGANLLTGDALMLNGDAEISIQANAQSELLLFDLPLHHRSAGGGH